MADQPREFNVNPIDWTARDTSWIPADGDKWWFSDHPDYDGLVYLYGDGTNVTADLDIYADPWQFQGKEYEIQTPTGFRAASGIGFKVSDDEVFLELDWDQKPYQAATTITYTPGSGQGRIVGGGGNVILDNSTFTYSFQYAKNHKVGFSITKVGAFSGIAGSYVVTLQNGNTGAIKFTLS